MAITALPPAPSRSDTPEQFVAKADAFVAALAQFVTEANAQAATLNSMVGAVTAGTAISIPCTFRSSTTDADPGADGNGSFRLNNTTVATTTVLFMDDKNSSGTDILGLLDTFDASTSSDKGQLRIYKTADATAYAVFRVTARQTATGYRKFNVTPIGWSASLPFAAADACTMVFTRTGDAGQLSGALGDIPLTGVKTVTYTEVENLAATSGTINIDWTQGHIFRQTEPTGAITYTMTPPVSSKPCHMQLHVLSDGSSVAQTFTWPGVVRWLGVQWTAVANKAAIISFYFDGTYYWASGQNEV